MILHDGLNIGAALIENNRYIIFEQQIFRRTSVLTQSARSYDIRLRRETSAKELDMTSLIGRTCALKGFIDGKSEELFPHHSPGSLFNVEAVPAGWGRTCSLDPMKKSAFSLIPQNQNLDFLCSLFPQIAFVPLFPLVFFVPLK